MRLSEFHRLVTDEFGGARGGVLLTGHVIAGLGGRTAAEALADGVATKTVWTALCEDLDVPRERWLGRVYGPGSDL